LRSSWVLHVDLDEFIAAVEVLRRPELAGQPVVVGGRGDPTERGVVSTASYAAREFGVGSGMPLRVAARKCPQAVFLPVDKPAYDAVSATIMETLRSLGGVVEVLGWDEAFLGVETDDPEAYARLVQEAILDSTRLHSTVGIGDNKLRAKLATGFGKPRGISRLTAENWYAVMADAPTSALWGIGSRTAKRLAALEIHTVRQLADADPEALAGHLGPTMGPYYHRLGLGLASSRVEGSPYVPRGHSRETTFQANLTDVDDILAEVRRLAGQVSADVGPEGRPVVRLTLKVRYAPFFTKTHSRKLPSPTDDAAEVSRAAVELATRLEPGRPVRLLGLRAEMTAPPPNVSSDMPEGA
jgi:DNA polymerase-4